MDFSNKFFWREKLGKKLKNIFEEKFFLSKKTKKFETGIFGCVEKNWPMRQATHFYIGADNAAK